MKLITVIQATLLRKRYRKLCYHSLLPSEPSENVEILQSFDDSGSSKKGMIQALKMVIRKQPDHVLIVQEDTIACKNIIRSVEKIVSMYPEELISYFTPKKLDTSIGACILEQESFCYAQCYSMPILMAKGIVMHESDAKSDDMHINSYLRNSKQTSYVTSISLVEHLGYAETTTPHEKARLQQYDKRRMAGRFIGLESEFVV